MNGFCSILFLTFGTLLKDPAIMIPNALGLVFTVFIAITLCVLPNVKPEVKEPETVKEKQVIEIAPLDFDKLRNMKSENVDYKIPASTERNYTDRDQPAAYEDRL